MKTQFYASLYRMLIPVVLFSTLALHNSAQAQCGSFTVIDNESFESGFGIWNDGGADCIRSTNYPNTGSRSIDLQDNTNTSVLTTNNLDLTAYTQIRVSFSYMPISFEGTEDFWLQISTNGGSSYSTVKAYVRNVDFTNNVRGSGAEFIAGPFTTNTRIRFRCDASGNGDDVYLDDIVLCGESNPNTPPTAVADLASTPNDPITLDVLSNDSDPGGDNITLTAITVAPNNGGSAVINNNGTPGDPTDDYIDYTPSGSYFGLETFTYQICDDGSPSMCATAVVSVTVTPNQSPIAVADPGNTNQFSSVAIDVLANDSDPDGQDLTITTITSAPDQGGSAVINNNGTPGDPTDDYIVFTPSGLFLGDEHFEYQICDNGNPNLCATAIVTITIAPCIDGSTPEISPVFSYGSEWKYDDSGADLGTVWKNNGHPDECWSYGNAELGFGDGDETTVINNHGGATYYFRKHFDVADMTNINNLLLGIKRDDGAIVYINGTEVYRSNMPEGVVNYTTLASSNQSGAEESNPHTVLVPASVLVNGDNVIAVEIHQDLTTSSDITFDMEMSHTLVSADTVLIASAQHWNYNDNGIDLGTGWKNTSIQETANEWEAGVAELGYGDGDEATVLDYGGDAANKYPTYYFRHYFAVNNFDNYDSLLINLRKDDGAIVYINGAEVFRTGMPTGTVNYNTNANFTASGANEVNYYTRTISASVLVPGTNVVAVEIHQVSGTSSDISFEMELHLINNEPSVVWSYNTISGTIFLDTDVNSAFGPNDVGQGTITVDAYQDVNGNGQLDLETDPRVFDDFTMLDGSFSMDVFPPVVQSLRSETLSAGDAIENLSDGKMSLYDTSLVSIDLSAPSVTLIDTGATWSYYDDGDHGISNWMEEGFDDSGWKSGSGDFGFGDGYEKTLLNAGFTTYYFRNTITIPSPDGPNYGLAKIIYKRDDGIVIYVNGVEVYRQNMPGGTVTYSTLASSAIPNAGEVLYNVADISAPGLHSGQNTIAVEIHQSSLTSSDVHFDLRMEASSTAEDLVGLRFKSLAIPQGSTIVDAKVRIRSASTTSDTLRMNIVGEDADHSAPFTLALNDISDRNQTTASTVYEYIEAVAPGQEVEIDGLKAIVQEVIDRAGWTPGNALTLIASGFDNHFYASEGGPSPELVVSYEDTTQNNITYIVTLDEEDLPEYYNFMTDGYPTVSFLETGRASATVNIGYIGSTSMCIASSDDNFDGFHIINRFSGRNVEVGKFGGATEIEAVALSKGADSILTVDGGAFGLVDPLTGAFTPYGTTVGTGNGSLGAITFDDIDGLAWDLTRDILWASHRRTHPAHDVILVIDQKTGQFVPDAFGPGVDYVVLSGPGMLPDIDDIALNPNTGNLFAMNNDNGAITNLIEIDVSNGVATVINSTTLNDMEGQGFHNDGQYYSTSGREGIPTNSFYEVDTSNAKLTFVGSFYGGGDYEGCDCKSGVIVNFIDGFAFRDNDEDGLFGGSDIGYPNATIYLYEDVNGDSLIDAGDLLIDSVQTGADGNFNFVINDLGTYLALIDTSDLPFNSELTTADRQILRIEVNGRFTANQNFGFRNGGVLPVELISFEGENNGLENNLYWATAAEINNDVFRVQHSLDNIDYETIGTVDGAGFSTEVNNYAFVDYSPATGINYYRLKQVDFDGTYEYSNTLSLEVGVESNFDTRMEVWPSITKGPVNLLIHDDPTDKEYNVQVYDLVGTVILEAVYHAGTNAITIDLSAEENGVYLVEVWNEDYQFSTKVILR